MTEALSGIMVSRYTETQRDTAIRVLEKWWDLLAAAEPISCPTFSDLNRRISNPEQRFVLITVTDGTIARALGCFLIEQSMRGYWLGEKRLFNIPMRSATLFGTSILGQPEQQLAALVLQDAMRGSSSDVIVANDVPVESGTYRAIEGLGWRKPSYSSTRKGTRHLIPIPATIDDYLATLRPSTRKATLRDLKIFAKLSPAYSVFASVEEADAFLTRAYRLSERTYQAGIGYGLKQDEQFRTHFLTLAAEGRMRAYLATVDGQDCAFAWGDVSHGIFYFRMTGYDPEFAKANAGKAILFFVLQDLVDSRLCASFDFGTLDMPYKSRFGTMTVECAGAIIGDWRRPKSVFIIALDAAFNALKTLLTRIVGGDRLQRLKRRLRGGGVGAPRQEKSVAQ